MLDLVEGVLGEFAERALPRRPWKEYTQGFQFSPYLKAPSKSKKPAEFTRNGCRTYAELRARRTP